MELLFNSVRRFEKALKNFSKIEQYKIIKKINSKCAGLGKACSDLSEKSIYPVGKILPSNGLKPSLYELRVDTHIRVLLMIDEDPLFDQVVVTLLDVLQHKDLAKSLRNIAESFYQHYVSSIPQ